MKIRVTVLLALAIAIAFCATKPASATPSYRLGVVLSNLQQLSDNAFANASSNGRATKRRVRRMRNTGPVKKRSSSRFRIWNGRIAAR